MPENGKSYFNLSTLIALDDLTRDIHQVNLEAGWWNCQDTGEDMSGNVYFQATKLGLIHSEVSEALEGLRKGIPDDKLPEYPMEAVEGVDILIRLLDYMGAKGYPVGEILEKKMAFNAIRSDHKVDNRKKKGGKKF